MGVRPAKTMDPMRLTSRRLNRATLARQLLLEREPLTVADAMCRIVALQAQSPASPYLALWNRVTDFDGADLDAAYANYTIVKASLMRIAVTATNISSVRSNVSVRQTHG